MTKKIFYNDDKNWIKKMIISEETSIKDAIRQIDSGNLGIAFVVDDNEKLLGVVTDGDIRRAIIQGFGMGTPAKKIMNQDPIIIKRELNEEYIEQLLENRTVKEKMPILGPLKIPVLDEKDRVNAIVILYIGEPVKKIKHPKLQIIKTPTKNEAIRRVLVVGGAGYLGSILCRKLLKKGYYVRVLDNLMYGDVGIRDLYNNRKFEFIHGDMRSIQTVVDAVKNTDAVIHLAAIVGDPASALDPEETIEINYLGTRMLAEICKYSQINRFMFASTCSVYGTSPTPEAKINENSPLNPVSLYARMKLKSEQGILELADENFSPTILRMATLYGLSSRMRFDLVVNTLTIKAIMENKFFIYGGDQWRPNLHVQDAADSFVKCLETSINKVGREIFNVGSNDENYRIIEVGEIINAVVPEAEMIIDKNNIDKRNYNVSFDKIQNNLDYGTKYTIRDGVEELVEVVKKGDFSDYTDPKFSNYKFLQVASS